MGNFLQARQRTGVFTLIGLIAVLFFAVQVYQAGQESGLEGDVRSEEVRVVVEETAVSPTTTASQTSQTASSLQPVQNVPTLNDSSLAPNLIPLTYQARMPAHTFQIHTVSRGETPNIIADQYNISAETLLGGNPWLSQESNQLQSGAELVILPVDGVLHTVGPGETLESISELYEISIEEIVAYPSNNIDAPYYRLIPESELLIPGAKVGQFYWTAPKSVGNSGGQWQIVGTGTFIWPVNGRCITQYYWFGHGGLDIGLSEGSSVIASDHGTVTYASFAAGQYYDYGNLIVLNHGNGYETFYAHLSGINVYPGQIVRQGDFIGSTGNTGRSSGPHIHFEVRLNDIQDDPLFYVGGGQNCT